LQKSGYHDIIIVMNRKSLARPVARAKEACGQTGRGVVSESDKVTVFGTEATEIVQALPEPPDEFGGRAIARQPR